MRDDLPSLSHPFVEANGEATPPWRLALPGLPRVALIDGAGLATREFTLYLQGTNAPLPNTSTPLVDAQLRPTPLLFGILGAIDDD